MRHKGRMFEADSALSLKNFLQTHLSLCLPLHHASKDGAVIYKVIPIIKHAFASRQTTAKGGLVTPTSSSLKGCVCF